MKNGRPLFSSEYLQNRECSFNKLAQVLQPNESGKLMNEDGMWRRMMARG